MTMWEKTFLLLLIAVEAAAASQCWQGATFSESVVSPAVESSGILRVPGVASLPQCVAACCDLPGYDLAWLFEGRCYILSCQQRENCRPRQRPGADSFLAFLQRASPQALVLQSLVRGAPRRRPPPQPSEAPGDVEAVQDLALFDKPRRDFSDSGTLDVELPEEIQEQRGGAAPETVMTTHQSALKGRHKFNQSEAEPGPTASTVSKPAASSVGNSSQGPEDRSRRPTDPALVKGMMEIRSGTNPTSTDSTQENEWSVASSAAPSGSMNPVGPLLVSVGSPVALAPPIVAKPAPDSLSTIQAQGWAVTSDPSMPSADTPCATTASQLRGANRGPLAVVGPDRTLFFPVSSLLLNGSSSTDDRGIVRYHWEAVRGPPGLNIDGVGLAVATVTGLRVGRYTFRLTVADQQGATDSASLTVWVQEATSRPPVAHASGSHTLTLPNNSLVLRGSMTDGAQAEVRYLWVRDSQSPAAGDVLYGSETQASLYLANLVEGTYLFQLKVNDGHGRSSTATATVEVRPEPGGGEEVELEMLVSVSQVSVAQKDKVVQQLAALLHVLDEDVQVRALRGHSHLSTVLRFSVRGPSGSLSSSRLVHLLRSQLLTEKRDYLLFRVLRVDTVCHGQCDPVSKECSCDPFWTENLVRRYLGDGESNCEWRLLYVVLTSFMLVVSILSVSWTFACCCKRGRQARVRRKTKYTILDNMDEQESVELRPKFSIKHRSTDHNCSLMMSESELDSDQDTVFSRERPVRSRNRLSARAAHNGHSFG
ncbi:dyslexia-associated protein KIAA0319 isoform X2 [Betta splendens]|uniref:Dyslexia-associated protein KIAA0319 isoform X2 n=1 Tax=Betta splendens TaxID=158456 RepID=A0A9W2XBH0_BETSP|nr:dyslexia-associated protein KIAA0319 isoform X2 [Betta splendens]